MRLLALDLGSRLTGWCAGTGEVVPEADAWAFMPVVTPDGYDYGYLLDQLHGYLDVAFARFRPESVVYEAPIHIPKGRSRPYGDTLHKMRLLYPLGAHLEWYCRRAEIPCHEVSVADIKREVTGNAYAPKDDMVAVARRCGLELPKGPAAEDAADAFGAWLLALRAYDKPRSARWDQRLWGGKGLL